MWTLIGLIVALGGPPMFVVLASAVFGASPSVAAQVALQLLYIGMAAFVLWIVVRRERRGLSSIGIRRPDLLTFAFGALLCLGTLYLLPILTDPLKDAVGVNVQSRVNRLMSLPTWLRVVLAVSGGAIEETLYRGYAIERLATLTGRRWAAGGIAAIAFGLAHAPAWGIGFALTADLPFGTVMTLFYLWRRDLLANALAHSGCLLVALVAAGR
jgi:membrane protease YdiL (CAAX protease family)